MNENNKKVVKYFMDLEINFIFSVRNLDFLWNLLIMV